MASIFQAVQTAVWVLSCVSQHLSTSSFAPQERAGIWLERDVFNVPTRPR